MANGYVGKLLFVDLTSGAITEETRDDAFYRKWIGGAGLAAATILERTKAGIDPLGPENMLAFATGPLTGTGVYGGGRYTVACKSPLTGAWADSNSGGTWGPELKFAGYDGLFVTGAAASPVCIVIDKGKASIVPADDLGARTPTRPRTPSRRSSGTRAPGRSPASARPARSCRCSPGIVNEKGRIAARSGVGAVMGSKKLKAIAVRGAKGARIGVADKEGLKAIQKRYGQELKDSPFHQGLTAAGTGGATSFLLSIGDCPADNWVTTGTDAMPTCDNLDAAKMDVYKLKSYGCHTCPVRCGALIQIDEGPFATNGEVHRPEYETLAALGPNCRNDEVQAVIKAQRDLQPLRHRHHGRRRRRRLRHRVLRERPHRQERHRRAGAHLGRPRGPGRPDRADRRPRGLRRAARGRLQVRGGEDRQGQRAVRHARGRPGHPVPRPASVSGHGHALHRRRPAGQPHGAGADGRARGRRVRWAPTRC